MIRRNDWTLVPPLSVLGIVWLLGALPGCGSGDDSTVVIKSGDATADTGFEAGPDVSSSDASDAADAVAIEAGEDGNADADADGAGDSGAPVGTLGGACYGNSTCNAGLGCNAGVCVPAAAPGSDGGSCYPNSTCDHGFVCTGGLCVQAPPAATYCDDKPIKALPYNIAADFNNLDVIGPGVADLTILSSPDCSEAGAGFPPIPSHGDASASGGEGGTDAAAGTDNDAEASVSGSDGALD